MKRLSIKSVFLVFIFLFCCFVAQSNADTIILKNGNKVEVEKAWEEGELIKGQRPYGLVSFRKESVENVVYEKETQYDSFEFDMWKAGITVEKAIKIAEAHNLPIHKAGAISGSKKFHPNVYNYIKTANNFYYKTKLMGKNAEVTLCFTPKSRLLHKVIVRLFGSGVNTDEYRNEINSMLTEKYGKKNKYSKQLFGKTRQWNVNNKYTVKMVIMPTNIDIEYSDNTLGDQNATEKKKIKDKKRKEYTEKDSPKF